MAPKLRRNFGFMFSFYGRTFFILFCATMLFALNVWLGWLMGVITALNGIFNGYVICVHPAFKSGELNARSDPYGGYTGGEDEMLSYLKRNPQLANKAGSAALTIAANNPDFAAQAVTAAARSKAGAPREEDNAFA